jgi:uncharacterized protein (TIGR02172 family)
MEDLIMPLIHAYSDGQTLTIKTCPRIDISNIDEISREFDDALSRHTFYGLVIDAGELEYISSMGLRKMLEIRKHYENFRIVNVNDSVYGTFEITGFTDIIQIEQAYRSISVEGCPVIGKGACGTVYKLDEERIVKVFVPGYPYEKILLERDNARKAFTHGIDTAIPFNIVRVGENYGLIYEIIHARTLKELMEQNRNQIPHYMKIYANYIHNMHSTGYCEGEYPDLKKSWMTKIDDLEGILNPEEKEIVKKVIGALPDRLTFVHGDINFGNLMIDDSKTVMIDMEDVKLGHPVYDLAFLYYMLKLMPVLLPEDVYQSMIGFSKDEAEILWTSFADVYFEIKCESERRDLEEQIHPYGVIRLLDGVPACFLAFEAFDPETKARAAAYYEPAAIRYKTEFFQSMADHIKTLQF